MINKIVKPEEVISLIKDGSVLAISGFNMATTPEYLIIKLYEHYEKTGHPKNLFIISDTFPGAPGRGIDLIAEKIYRNNDTEFIRGVLLPYLGWSKYLQKLTLENKIEAYTWSIGIVAYWFREIASGRPGLLSYIGLYTFMDPRQGGGALNKLAEERKTCKVDILSTGGMCVSSSCVGEEILLYQAPKPNVAFIRGTTADEIGNITMEKECMFGTVLNIAQATKAQPNPGFVIAQVERIARFGSLNPKDVQVPGPLIDYIVISPPQYHYQTTNIQYDPRLSGRIIPPLEPEFIPDLLPRLEFNVRKVVARRVLLFFIDLIMKLGKPITVNLGIGVPDVISSLAYEEGISDFIMTTIESGPWGGIALSGPDFGASIGPFAVISMPDMFTNYEGGVVDAASLGFLQVDKEGNVNPSMLPGRLPGPGGFPVIAAGVPRVFFAGLFTAGKRDIRVKEGRLKIVRDGDIIKFVDKVYRIVFSGKFARMQKKEVYYVTERAVFKLVNDGLELIEYAPGIDIDKDIIKKMEFEPKISKDAKMMDKRLFIDGRMGIRPKIVNYFKKIGKWVE